MGKHKAAAATTNDPALSVDFQKYYDKYSPWLDTPSLRKQNKNLELKTGIQIHYLEKVM